MSPEYLEISSKTNLIINDTPIPDEVAVDVIEGIKTKSTVDFRVLSAREYGTQLDQIISLALASTKSGEIAAIFPGEGAKVVRDFLSTDTKIYLGEIAIEFYVPTIRRFNGSKSSSIDISIPPALVEAIKDGQVKRLLVCDDVVATGQTLNAIKESIIDSTTELDESNYNPWERFSFPKVRVPLTSWQTACWLFQKTAKTSGMQCDPVAIYYRRDGKVPLNSLSTLLSNTEKSKVIGRTYSKKYFPEPKDYWILISNLKELL